VAKVTMPQLGESVAEGTIGRWLKKPGDRVEKYEPIVEVVTDKVNAEVPSPFAGVLTAILAEEGATVPNNAEIAEIETTDSDVAAAAPQATPPASPPPAASPSRGRAGDQAGTGRRRTDAARVRRSRSPNDAGRSPAAPRARPLGRPGFRDRRRRAHHPR
jgi:pyruvate/2-oxoglutarate dehydrogenase complex dihydrolipoamide acyltransferase (E2) component